MDHSMQLYGALVSTDLLDESERSRSRHGATGRCGGHSGHRWRRGPDAATLPLGLSIPAGVTFDVDGKARRKLDLQTCDRGGCLATTNLDADSLAAMQSGQNLDIVFSSTEQQKITLAMSLAGFSAAYQRVK